MLNNVSDPFAFILIGFIALLGFVGQYIFRKTQIPVVIWLVILGILVGPVFGLINVQSFREISGFVSSLALIIILFEAGLRTNFRRFVKEFPYSVFLACVSFLLSFIFLSIFFFFIGLKPEVAIVAASVLGGTSSIVVVPLVSRLTSVSENVKLALSIESVITDILVIVVSLSLYNFFVYQGNLYEGIKGIVNMFLIGASFGVIFGILFLPLYERAKNIEYSYMFVISLLFFVYACAGMLGGNGGIACLFFGLLLGNSRRISQFLYLKEEVALDNQTKHFFSLLSFLITTYFFVFMGFFFSVNDAFYLLVGFVATLILLACRYVFVHLSGKLLHFNRFERTVVGIMISRGLAAGVVSFLLLETGFFDTHVVNIVFSTILFSILIPSVFIYWLHHGGEHGAGNASKSRKG